MRTAMFVCTDYLTGHKDVEECIFFLIIYRRKSANLDACKFEL